MKDFFQIKQKLYKACLLFIDTRSKTVNNTIQSNKNALFSETKSSAGDKHETGRAMLQLEMEKASQQLRSIDEMRTIIQKVLLKTNRDVISLGSLVITNKANYYLSISAGKISVDAVDYYAISANTPIGQQLLGKRTGDIISFNSSKIKMIY